MHNFLKREADTLAEEEVRWVLGVPEQWAIAGIYLEEGALFERCMPVGKNGADNFARNRNQRSTSSSVSAAVSSSPPSRLWRQSTTATR